MDSVHIYNFLIISHLIFKKVKNLLKKGNSKLKNLIVKTYNFSLKGYAQNWIEEL